MRLQVFLKVDKKNCADVTSRGRPFQTRGAATPKIRSPIVFSLERPITLPLNIILSTSNGLHVKLSTVTTGRTR